MTMATPALAVLIVLAGAFIACGGGNAAEPSAPSPSAAPAGAAPPAGDWQDSEPEGAQALAEQVALAEHNRDKTTRLRPSTTRLRMSMTTLVDRTTGLSGRRTGLDASATGLGERLGRLRAEETATEVTIRLPGALLFDFDSAAIRPDAERSLRDVVEVIAAYGGRPVRIEGHTDSVASDAYNRELSQRRADAIRGWLEAHGVAAGRLTTVGHGESRPVADNGTAAGRQQNRRVEVVIEKAR
jgi:outer membrane protein OmpA-like peptidoglycan-associated protein